MTGKCSSGRRRPFSRTIGCVPAVRWRSDALSPMTSSRMSAKSKFMLSPLSAGGFGSGESGDLGDRGHAQTHLLEPVVAQQAHSLLHRDVLDRLGGGALDCQIADLLGDLHDLVEADAALVAGVAAAGAAGRLVGLDVEGCVELGRLERV